MLDWLDGGSVCCGIGLPAAMVHQLLARDGVLAFAQPGKVLGVDRSGTPESLGQLALPLSDDGAVLFPIVLLG
jgi:hypothetical protein